MSTAIGLTPMEQTPFVASNVDNLDLADVGSPMQQDGESPVLDDDREKVIVAMKTPTAEELETAVSHSTSPCTMTQLTRDSRALPSPNE